MSKSKALAVQKTEGPSPSHAALFHTSGLMHRAMASAYKVITGLQLLADQEALSKLRSPRPWTFDQWLDENEATLGFKRAAAFDYMKIAADQREKLLALKNPELTHLLKRAPATFDRMETVCVLNYLAESTEGRSLRLLREDLKRQQKAIANGEPEKPLTFAPSSVEQDVQLQFNLFAQADTALDDTVNVGDRKVLLLESWSPTHLEDLIDRCKRRIRVAVKILHAKKGRK